MKLSLTINQRIGDFPRGKIFGYDDLLISKENFFTAAKVLERAQKKGLIKRYSRGLFYRPQQTVFGELEPGYEEILRFYLFRDRKRIAYETGTSLYNTLGLTTQVPVGISIASWKRRISVDRGNLRMKTVKSYVEVTDNNYEVLGILDAFKDAKIIPDCSVGQAIRRLSAIVKDFDNEKIRLLTKCALAYPPRTRALVGAILENLGRKSIEVERLSKSLNPFTVIKLGITKRELPTKSNWYIK